MAACQFVKQLLVQDVALLPTARRHEDVSTDVLVDDLTVCCHAAEGDVHIAIELNCNLEQIREEFILSRGDFYINVRTWKTWQISLA